MAIWNCASCGEDNDSDFGVCWNCGAKLDGGPKDPTFVADDTHTTDDGEAEPREIACLRCGAPMRTLGRMRFHEGSRLPGLIYGNIGELLINRESFDVYACSGAGCGKVEFFAITLTEVSLGG
ncbi:MAG: zinc ribbon domain-containing protein [Xanthomonadaceae bacterium]|nr:zinc ribbon domain-containing protein [Xanthomonadaceae bacterium]